MPKSGRFERFAATMIASISRYDEWPVVVWGRGLQEFEAFECGLTDFLAGVAKKEIFPEDFPEGRCDWMFRPSADFPNREGDTL